MTSSRRLFLQGSASFTAGVLAYAAISTTRSRTLPEISVSPILLEDSKAPTDRTEFYIGEAMVGDGNELAHIDVMIGSKSGPVGNAFARALANQEAGFNKLLVTLEPNSAVKPSTVLIPKVQLSTADETFRLFGPAQFAIASAVIESVKDGTISKSLCDDWVIVCGVFIHSDAEDHEKILAYNFEATKLAIKRALNEEPSINQVLRQREDITAPAADQ